MRRITPRKPPSEWPVADNLAALQRAALVGLSLAEAHASAEDNLEQQEPVTNVKTVLLVNYGVSSKAMADTAMRALTSRRMDLEIAGYRLQCVVTVKRKP